MQRQKSAPPFSRSLYRVITQRPGYFFRYARGYLLFLWTGCLRALLNSSQIELGRNVRLQKLGSLRVERPKARIKIGDHSIVYENARLEAFGEGHIEIGSRTILGDIRIVSRGHIKLGDQVITSWNVFIQDFDPHPVDSNLREIQIHNLCANFKPGDGSLTQLRYPGDQEPEFQVEGITIGNNVWIGANAIILKGARIGEGSIVAAGAVVTGGDYPARSLIAGNPARIIKNVHQPH